VRVKTSRNWFWKIAEPLTYDSDQSPDGFANDPKRYINLHTAAVDGSAGAGGWSYLTGDALYAWCTSSADWDRQTCMNYIMGVSDGVDYVQGGYPNRAMAPFVCSPYLTGKDLKDIVVTYLKDPSNRHYSAAEAVTFALENAWSCKKRP
jgi:Ssp1 endopeptidase immunity protein Rap1a